MHTNVCTECFDEFPVADAKDSTNLCYNCDRSGGVVEIECAECGAIQELELEPGEAAYEFHGTVCQECNDRRQNKEEWDLEDQQAQELEEEFDESEF